MRLCSSSWIWKLFKRSARFLKSNSAAESSSTKMVYSRSTFGRGWYRGYYSTLGCCSVELCLSSLNYLFITRSRGSQVKSAVRSRCFSTQNNNKRNLSPHTELWVCDANTWYPIQLKNEKIRPSRGCKKKLKTYIQHEVKNWSTYFLLLEIIVGCLVPAGPAAQHCKYQLNAWRRGLLLTMSQRAQGGAHSENVSIILGAHFVFGKEQR